MHLPNRADSVFVLGSSALIHYYSTFRLPADWDIVGTYDACIKFIQLRGKPSTITYPTPNKIIAKVEDSVFEAEIAWGDYHKTSDELFDLCCSMPAAHLEVRDVHIYFADPSIIYMLKMSHRYLKNSPHFLKTMQDIHFLRAQGIEMSPNLLDFYDKRKKETYWYEHPNLDRSKEDFFSDDGVPYVYDHDDIHKAVAHVDGKPAYTFYQVPGKDVLCSKELFFKCEEYIRLCGVIEETYVLALERSQIPSNFTEDRKVSFLIALEKVCTSITSGWFREYAWENYDKVLAMYNPNYVDRCIEAIPTMRKYNG